MINFTPHIQRATPLLRRRAAGCSGWISICALLHGGGCATPPIPPDPFPERAAESRHAGDWDDVDSAVIWGVDKHHWVIHLQWNVDEQTRLYELRNSEGVSARLRVRRATQGATDLLDLTASVGPFGDVSAERRLIDVVARRLGELHGVEVAPIK